MKKTFAAITIASLLVLGCAKSSEIPSQEDKNNTDCGTYKSGQQLYLGPQGGCYYYSSGKNKEYVERSACKCSL
jgi:hypothetical protein